MLSFETMERKLQSALSLPRYIHTMGVVKTAVKMAKKWGVDVDEARVAALLHDCAKDYPEEMKRRFCKEFHVPLDDTMKECIDLCHGPLGAEVAKREYGVTDEAVCDAIRYHTTGRPGMSDLEKIIFIADYIEPNRKPFAGLEEGRALAYEDLDLAMEQILKDTIDYVKERKRPLHHLSVEAYTYYHQKGKEIRKQNQET